ncbi:MAG: DUF3576 domain-containing protein [Proteobacteria bacterium]|nr:DUF3576 domain-containing protein [Pseudomonadota bacterium]
MPNNTKITTAIIAIAVISTALTACGNIKTTAPEVNPTDMPKGPGLLSGESGNLLDAFKRDNAEGQAGGNIGVNIFLWRASLESISFMPIQQADSNGGVIATDWYSAPEAPSERVRANILILGKSLRPDALKVNLFKQTKASDGKWADAPANPATTRALEDAILTKARALRVQSLSTK